MNKHTFQVPLQRKDWMQPVLEKLLKRAIKVGLPKPTVTYSEPHTVKRTNRLGKKVDVEVVDVTVETEPMKLDGYTFIGRFETTKNGNVLYPVPDAALDEKFRTADCHCDHCHSKRYRKDLYVFQADNGEQIQVGKQCLRDFVGHDPAGLMYNVTLDKEFSDVEEESWGGGSGYYVDLVTFGAATQAVIEHEGGFISKAAAETGNALPTSLRVCTVLWPSGPSAKEYAAIVRPLIKDEMYDKAREALRWIAEEWKAHNDYAWNLKVLAKNGAITSHKQFGLGASLWPTYEREMGRLKELEFKRAEYAETVKDSEHLGKAGDRLKNLKAVVSFTKFINNGDWGDVYLYKFLTNEGCVLTWFSGAHGLKAGDTVILNGTVKGHTTYNNVKETQLTRCRVEKVEEEEAE